MTEVRAGVELASEMTPQERAIAIVEDSRRTHVEWRSWLTAHPDADAAFVGDAQWHTECIANYDEVLQLLWSL